MDEATRLRHDGRMQDAQHIEHAIVDALNLA